jgi:photosystem II stability/assembly factor-like uncharacterized protein
MNIIYCLAFLVLLQFSSCSDRAFQLPQFSARTDSVQIHNRDNVVDANIVFKSADGGQTWQDISEGLPERVIDVYGAGRNDFFADDNGLWLTTGNGLYHNKPNSTAPFWTKEIFPGEHSHIAHGMAGIFAYNCWGSGIFQKANGTGVWSPVFTNFQEKRVLSVFETAGGTIFICSDRGLFKSINSGKSWKPVGVMVGKLVESNGVILATSQGGILRSADDGESWALVVNEGGVGIDVANIKGGFAAINYSTAAKTRRIRTSYDGGKTWQPIDAEFPGQASIDSTWRPINVGNPAQGNADSSWHPKEAPLAKQEYKTSIIQVGENFFCGHTDGIYRSLDKGKTWKLVLASIKGKMFKLSVSGNVIYAIQMESHC